MWSSLTVSLIESFVTHQQNVKDCSFLTNSEAAFDNIERSHEQRVEHLFVELSRFFQSTRDHGYRIRLISFLSAALHLFEEQLHAHLALFH